MRSLCATLTAVAAIVLQTMAAPTLGVRTRTERPPEMDAIAIAEVEFEGQNFTFVLPRNWRFEPDPAGQNLRFHSELGRALITVQFSQEIPADVLKSTDALRQFAAPSVAATSVLEEFPIYSDTGRGKGALFGYGSDGRCRAAVIPLGRGGASFVLTCRTNELFSQQVFGALITSFRKSPAPK